MANVVKGMDRAMANMNLEQVQQFMFKVIKKPF
jgi:hypothetical protein